MNELSEFFSSVAKEKKRVEEEKIRFTPRVNVNLTDLSSFFGTITEAKREHVIIAKRESTKLDALQGFFDRLNKFETALNENIEKQKREPHEEYKDEVAYDIEEVEKQIEVNKEKQASDAGLSETEFAFYNIFIAEISKTKASPEADKQIMRKVVELTKYLVAMMDEASQIVGFFQKESEKRRVRKLIKRAIIESKLDSEKLIKKVTDRFMDLAEVKFK